MDLTKITQDYVAQYGPGGLPAGKETPYFQVGEIFEPEFLEILNKTLLSIPGDPKEDEGPDVVMGSKNRDHVITVHLQDVTYDDEHHVVEMTGSVDDRYHGVKTPSKSMASVIERTKLILLNRYGEELQLTGTHQIWMDCGRYRIPRGEEIDPLSWHKDPLTTWTMVTMFNDPDSPTDGWEGGDILLAPTQDVETDDGVKEIPIEEQAIHIQHAGNKAIFFHNYRTNHRVTALKGRVKKAADPKSKPSLLSKFRSKKKVKEPEVLPFSNRTIWTIFLWDDMNALMQ